MFIIGLLVLLALLLSSLSALVRPSGTRVITTLVLALLWPFVNLRWEGPVLWVPLPGHGLTLGDLIAPIPPVLLAGRWLLTRRATEQA